MAELTPAQMTALSNQFRAAANNLPENEFEHLISALQEIFGVRNRSNARLWITNATIRRNFINPQIGSLELEMRVVFAKAYLNLVEPTTPMKEARFTGGISQRARRFRNYLLDDYTQNALFRLSISTAGWAMEYEADSSPSQESDSIPDDASAEWQTPENTTTP